MLSELRDDYSTYLSPMEVRAQFASSGGTADMSQVLAPTHALYLPEPVDMFAHDGPREANRLEGYSL
jgi:hypothetical protein